MPKGGGAIMHRAVGRVVISETWNGIRDLTVVLFDAQPEAYRVFMEDDLVGKPSSILCDLPVQRLGSAISDAKGQFTIEYSFEVGRCVGPNLAVIVSSPDVGGKGCPKILHASCDIRVSAGEIENYLLAIPNGTLHQLCPMWFGLDGLSVKVSEVHNIFEKIRTAWHQEEQEESTLKFSEIYRKKIETLQEAGTKKRFLENDVRFALPIISIGGEGQAGVAFDHETKKWFMQKGDEKSEIKFIGIASASELELEERPRAGIGVVLDENKKEFQLVISSAPLSLRALETNPGELFLWNFKQRYKRTQNR
jgi:hypothetical protein